MISTGSQFRAARALLGWSRETLAERAGVHPGTITYWERNANAPRQDAVAPERMLAALRSAGVEIASEPRPGVFLAGNG